MTHEYHDEDLRLIDLAGEDYMIRDTVFIGCTLKGPAVIVPIGDLGLYFNTFTSKGETFLWTIPEDQERVVGAIGVEDCFFRGCTFDYVGIASREHVLDAIRESMEGDRG